MGNNSKKPTTKPKTVGRPKKYNIDTEEVKKLAEYGCSNIQIADFFGCDESLIRKSYSEYLAKGRAIGIKELRRVQYEAAINDRNITMLIWLGKQMLGQAEKAELQMNRPIKEIEYLEI